MKLAYFQSRVFFVSAGFFFNSNLLLGVKFWPIFHAKPTYHSYQNVAFQTNADHCTVTSHKSLFLNADVKSSNLFAKSISSFRIILRCYHIKWNFNNVFDTFEKITTNDHEYGPVIRPRETYKAR